MFRITNTRRSKKDNRGIIKMVGWDTRPKRLPNVLRKKDLVKFFNAVESPKHMMAYIIAFFCGLRASEVINLKVEDVNLESKFIKIKDGKGKKDRYITLPSIIIPLIEKWLKYLGERVYFIPSKDPYKEKYNVNSLRTKFRNDLKKAGMLKVDGIDGRGHIRHTITFHCLRHSYATFLYERGIDLITLRDLLGHASVRSTQIYAHVSTERKQMELDKAFNHNNHYLIPNHKENNMINNPLEILTTRLVKGEIDLDTYENIKKRIK